jgi:UDP-N-acetylglucosamine acyltransferase
MSVKPIRERAPGARIHPTAVVEPDVRLAAGVSVGPYAVLTGDVTLGPGCAVESHVVLQGPAVLGEGCHLFPYCVVGTDPQDQKFSGERTVVRIGDRSTLREFVTVNRGTGLGGGETVIGDDVYIMAHAHVAHDCRLGRRVVVANGCSLAGHVDVADSVVFGGMAACGQFVRIGTCAFVAAGAMVERDVPPFGIAAGDRARLRGVNLVGLKRAGVDAEARVAITAAYTSLLGREAPFARTVSRLEERYGHIDEIASLVSFIRDSELGVVPPG